MKTFDCSGWIHIALSDCSDVVFIKLSYCEDHVLYCSIDIPEEVEQYVHDNLKFTPTQSAWLLLEAFKISSPDHLYTVEPIPVEQDEGITVIAFALPEILHQWGGHLGELQLDSAWNTNGAHFEVFALLSKIYGSGLPLGYLLIQLNIGEPGAKEWFISHFISYINKHWHLQIIFTLINKNWSEINSFLAIIADAKHQLCYWHAI
ncbi:hypothetical protein F5148DRAFT_1275487 [Russula earlei]|uniref:Uncharacterized protein n=1 Tax=Russula earlei TaxID=71964 RepID=A0ACC0UBM6_9AGAM|nr:hypothetical protein F5148DRAFT_1275487 [Russula earlei]